MKKLLLTFVTVFAASLAFGQYYYIPFLKEGKNPMDLNKDSENPYPAQVAGWNAIWNGDATASVAYTANQTIPFSFNFNGNPVTEFKVSNAGFVTFNTAATENLSTFGNAALPNANIPDNSICVLGIKPRSATGGYKSAILTKTFGTAGNRQHWIQFNFFGEANIVSGWTYWAIVLEEGTNNIYIVDMKTLCVTAASQLCGNNVKMSAGIQINSTTAVNIGGSPNLGAGNIATNIFDASDNTFYRFTPGVKPEFDMATTKITNTDIVQLSEAPFTISGIFMNQGNKSVPNFEFTYQINNETPVVATINTTVAVNAKATINHPTKWTPSAAGLYKVTIWPGKIDGNTDLNAANDKTEMNIYVTSVVAQRTVLHEVFTSSTCGPCTAGNLNTDNNIFPMREGKFTVIKYQQDFPGTGDPYATAEGVARRGFYGVNSIPNMQVDGGWNGNAQSYTLNLFDGFYAKPAFMELSATHTQNSKSFNVSVKIKPLADFNNPNLRLFVVVNEVSTHKNLKSNGETDFYHVMKKMIPDGNGTAVGNMTFNVEKSFNSLSYTFPGKYRLPANGSSANQIKTNTENSVENFGNMEVVVFVQDIVTGQVFQSAYSAGTVTGIDNPDALQESVVVYPNPTQGATSVDFTLENSHKLDINLYNSLGQLVKVIDSKTFEAGQNTVTFSASDLPSGVYFVKILGDSFTSTQSVIVK